MTAREALDAANTAGTGERLRRRASRCVAGGARRREPLADDPGRWTWCPDCLIVFDGYGTPVNVIQES